MKYDFNNDFIALCVFHITSYAYMLCHTTQQILLHMQISTWQKPCNDFMPFPNRYIQLNIFRQNYNFDMLAMIWLEIVCWFLKICQDLKRFSAQEHRIVLILIFICAKQFYVLNMEEAGKKFEINRQTLVIWWLNSRRYM